MGFKVNKTTEYETWLDNLDDDMAIAKITLRIRRLQDGNWGKVDPVGAGISELKIDYGPGYRVYVTKTGETEALVLCGGTKKRQQKDIDAAKLLAKNYKKTQKAAAE